MSHDYILSCRTCKGTDGDPEVRQRYRHDLVELVQDIPLLQQLASTQRWEHPDPKMGVSEGYPSRYLVLHAACGGFVVRCEYGESCCGPQFVNPPAAP